MWIESDDFKLGSTDKYYANFYQIYLGFWSVIYIINTSPKQAQSGNITPPIGDSVIIST